MTSDEELREAAVKLRELARHASRWPDWDDLASCVHQGLSDYTADRKARDAEARWVAAMSPAIAEPLAALLEEAAGNVDLNLYGEASIRENAVKIARQISSAFAAE